MKNEELKILCPYCNAVWDAKMETDYHYAMGSEWTGRYSEEINVKIYCSSCNKLIYTKNNNI